LLHAASEAFTPIVGTLETAFSKIIAFENSAAVCFSQRSVSPAAAAAAASLSAQAVLALLLLTSGWCCAWRNMLHADVATEKKTTSNMRWCHNTIQYILGIETRPGTSQQADSPLMGSS
jgi:hypothetical protein